jgi:ketosteroid isomerase-like protein
MSRPANPPLPDPVTHFLDAVAGARIADCDSWADDVVMDATVPNWRLSRRGADAVRDEYRNWFAHVGRLDGLRRMATAGGEVVEYTVAWEEDGVPHAAHHVHILDVADGRIVHDTVMCGGRWPASLLADMEEAARA